ncbi:ABC transporter substrate-binding protein [Paenibacillus sp. NEAU-GSW1]|uniref:ABC transporter substrate-binding protein n=1 Tax=Paenibacillus sp. NEAU-GSW1 TaxID=2682486 RepID=UPI0012E2A2B6|nr:ABC transporter substrate-binding protein [Paenibacillus sp. NEAU-GSW1]MUT67177.1 substrate-binding domain-containing protein [Paenibacillus sp. NEAU-GSW1]
MRGRSVRIIYICLACVFALTACRAGGSEQTANSNSPTITPIANRFSEGETELPDSRKIRLGFSQLGSESDWRLANTESIREAAEEAGIELLFDNAEQSQQKQVEAVRSFIAQKVDVIAIAPVIETGWEPVLQEAKQAGIPVIVSDRFVELQDPSLVVTFVGSDFYDEGQKAAKYMIDKMRDQGDRIGIVELRGTEGSTPSIERGSGFHDLIKDRENFKLLESESADFTFAKGKEVMRKFLERRGSDIKVLFSHNDDMALGAVEAIEEFGMRPGKDIIIISVDGTRKAFEKMAEGKINCIVECNPLLGPILMQLVMEISEGRSLPNRIVTPESVFTESMAAAEVNNRKY